MPRGRRCSLLELAQAWELWAWRGVTSTKIIFCQLTGKRRASVVTTHLQPNSSRTNEALDKRCRLQTESALTLRPVADPYLSRLNVNRAENLDTIVKLLRSKKAPIFLQGNTGIPPCC